MLNVIEKVLVVFLGIIFRGIFVFIKVLVIVEMVLFFL